MGEDGEVPFGPGEAEGFAVPIHAFLLVSAIVQGNHHTQSLLSRFFQVLATHTPSCTSCPRSRRGSPAETNRSTQRTLTDTNADPAGPSVDPLYLRKSKKDAPPSHPTTYTPQSPPSPPARPLPFSLQYCTSPALAALHIVQHTKRIRGCSGPCTLRAMRFCLYHLDPVLARTGQAQ